MDNWTTFRMYILGTQEETTLCAGLNALVYMCTYCMVVFKPTDNSRGAYKMCKGVKRAAGISPMEEDAVSKPVLNPIEQHHDYYKKKWVCVIILSRIL